ncbi:MAG: hypothetical protein IPO86_16325 [Saprospiraceae bacterium]|nr:hypothetical protein [Saprospiraceae bacterium]
MTKKKIEIEIVNLNCAGIDIGSKSHFVAVGQGIEDVREFGVFADDLVEICAYLLEYRITSVALESTGINGLICTGIGGSVCPGMGGSICPEYSFTADFEVFGEKFKILETQK